MSVGLAVIARDERENLPHLLKSVEGAFDRVVLLDTGSEDDTISTFTGWARDQPGMTYSVGRFEWTGDFAEARNASYRLLLHGAVDVGPDKAVPSVTPMVEWTCWADCDDVIHNASAIRELCAEAEPHIAAFLCGYAYSFTAPECEGQCISYLWRERMVRVGMSEGWEFRVHEAQHVTGGPIMSVPPEVLEWRHRKFTVLDGPDDHSPSNTRNLAILKKWAEDEPDNSRVLGDCALESMMHGEFDGALAYFDRYFASAPDWDQERAQAHRRHALCLAHFGRYPDMIETSMAALHVLPSWPDTYLSLAEAYLALGNADKALYWAREAAVKGAPQQTLMVINPTDYTFLPRKLLAAAHALAGDYEAALAAGHEALSIVADRGLAEVMQGWQGRVKRKHTSATVILMGEQLIAHDEQLKARYLFEHCLPHFVESDPAVVAFRSMIRERLHWANNPESFQEHYATGGSKPEDFAATGTEEQIDALCAFLPRTQFLKAGLLEQAGVEVDG
jgi:tetratricopeptide (TPR) repeat protein